MTSITQFFGEVKTELQKVVWPTRKETFQYTVTVVLFSLVVALVLGGFDYLLLKVFEKIVAK